MLIKIKRVCTLVLVMLSMLVMTACGESGSKVVLTTGFGTNEVFKVGSERATTTEMMLYLINIANQYEQVYGEELWSMKVDENTTMFENLKEEALAQLSQIKAMKLLAAEHEVTLTEEETAAARSAAETYLATLSEAEKDALGITDGAVVEQLYSEKLLADKLYAYLIRDVNPEISDDEARIITVQHILLKTYTVDEHGNREELSEEECEVMRSKAEEIRTMAVDGESFDTLISKYSEDSKGTYSFGMGDMEESFEEAAYALATDEISPVVRTSHGYHIIKCISTLDREQTDLNKEKLLISRKQEVFGDTYNAFVAQLDKRANSELILSLTLPDRSIVDTAEFFTVYETELGGLFE
ncbi:MAG: peptidylprolyl isomerase [Lachnospiraceae bacterium]|nr:peptidylprolyl isomerase [Lachnospiraceae bacterium]